MIGGRRSETLALILTISNLKAGRLLRAWTSISGQTHPKSALILAPNDGDLRNQAAGQHFAISKEKVWP